LNYWVRSVLTISVFTATGTTKISRPQPYTSHLIYTQTHKSQVVAMGGGAGGNDKGRAALMMVTSIMTSVRILPPSAAADPVPSAPLPRSVDGRAGGRQRVRSASIAVGCLRGQDERERWLGSVTDMCCWYCSWRHVTSGCRGCDDHQHSLPVPRPGRRAITGAVMYLCILLHVGPSIQAF